MLTFYLFVLLVSLWAPPSLTTLAAVAKGNFYEVLGIPRNADEAEIKKAHRRLAKKYVPTLSTVHAYEATWQLTCACRWHPDKNRSNEKAASVKFKEAQEAYEVCDCVPLITSERERSVCFLPPQKRF
jgi:hypothetical protein